MSEPYFAANECEERTHYFRRNENHVLLPFHLDDQVCKVSEYYLPELDAPWVEQGRRRQNLSTASLLTAAQSGGQGD